MRLLRWLCIGVWGALAACTPTLDGPAPSVDALQPGLVCNQQLTTEITLRGAGLSPLAVDALTEAPGLALPKITLLRTADIAGAPVTDTPIVLNEDTSNPDLLDVTWVSQEEMRFLVKPELNLQPGTYQITVENANGKTFTAEELLGVIPPPRLDSVEPDLFCTEDGDTTVTLRGDFFLDFGGVLPTVTINNQSFPVTAVNTCRDVPGPEAAQLCTEATITVPQSGLPSGIFDVTITNAAPAGCTSTEDVTLVIVPSPDVVAVVPDLVCTAEGDNTLVLSGTGFLTVEGVLPAVAIGGQGVVVESVAGCSPVSGTTLNADECDTITVTLPQGLLSAGSHEVVVTNPAPAGCSSTGNVTIAVVDDPTIVSINPNPICNEQGDSLITITGTSFITVDGANPEVLLDGVPVAVDSVGGCVAIVGTTLNAQSCTDVTVAIPQSTLQGGDHTFSVTNPDPAACSVSSTIPLTISLPPIVTDVIPNVICNDGGTIVIEGENFSPNASAFLDGFELQINSITINNASPDVINAVLPGGFAADTYDITVDNNDGCSSTLTDALVLTPGPTVFFVDPRVVFNGINTQATIFVSGLSFDGVVNAPDQVIIRPAGTTNDIDLTANITFDPAEPNQIQAVIPSTLAPGSYDVLVRDDSCDDTLENGLIVTDVLSIAIDEINAPFGKTDDDTSVIITAIDPAPVGFVQFQSVPTAYLNPQNGGVGSLAAQMQAVNFESATQLTAVVPDGLPPGVYDLIIVNPDGTVGLKPAAFTVTDVIAPPPLIDSVSPGSVINQPGQVINIFGENFRSPTVEATCQDDAGVITVLDGTSVTVNVAGDTIAVTFDMGAISDGAVCVIRVTNDDATFADFSAISVANPSQNLANFIADDAMLVARRALASTAGRVTGSAKFLYAIGGDDGTDNGLLSSVEASSIDFFGSLNPWFALPAQSQLPEGRSFSTAVTIDRFVYLAGGRVSDGAGGTDATDSVLRAQLLDPTQTPDINDIAFDIIEAQTTLPAGLWFYRVSAVLDVNDPSNPGGETLASDPLSVFVPDVGSAQIALTIFWSSFPNAAAYRIYRTDSPDQSLADAHLIAEVPASELSFIDNGVAPGTAPALPLGSLGAWHEVGPLSVPREGAGVTFAQDPTIPERFYLYTIGGRDNAGVALNSYDLAAIDINADGSQTVSAFTNGGAMLLAAESRWQLGAVTMTNANSSKVAPGQSFVYALSGTNANESATIKDTTAALVGANGALIQITPVDQGNQSTNDAGYGYAGANNFLFVFGGANGGPSTGAVSSELCAIGEAGCGANGPPVHKGFNALGISLLQARYLMGSVNESAFIFLLGGDSGAQGATNTIERTHL